MNAALAMIEAAAPKDELVGALAVQMVCTHMAATAVLGKLDSGFGTERRVRGFRVNRGSFAQGVCDADGSSSTPASWRATICSR